MFCFGCLSDWNNDFWTWFSQLNKKRTRSNSRRIEPLGKRNPDWWFNTYMWFFCLMATQVHIIWNRITDKNKTKRYIPFFYLCCYQICSCLLTTRSFASICIRHLTLLHKKPWELIDVIITNYWTSPSYIAQLF